MSYLQPKVAQSFQASAVDMFDSLENPDVSFVLTEPGVLDAVTQVRAAGTEHSCRVLPAGVATVKEAGERVAVGDQRFVVLQVGLAVIPAIGWGLKADATDLGQIKEVTADPAGATVIVWVPRA